MKLKVPPAVVFVIFGLLMYLLAKFLPVGDFDFFGRRYVMAALLIAAMSISIAALFQFSKKKTTIDPLNPSKASQLVTGGIYNYTRNPMYLGLLLILLAWGLWLGNAFNTVTAGFFVAYMNRFQIEPEEKVLTELFGKTFQQYCIKVRRWF